MSAFRIVLARSRVVVPLLLLAACAWRPIQQHASTPVPRYVPPAPPQDAAKLSMKSSIPLGKSYVVDVLADTSTCTGRRRVGRSSGLIELSATSLATERWQTLDVIIVEPSSYCWTRVSFTPRHGRTYQLAPRFADNHCNAYVFDTTDPEAPQLESSLRYRRSETASCVPLASADRIDGGQAPKVSVSATDLPTNPAPDAVSASKAPRPASPVIPPSNDAVTDDDLNGLTGH